MGMCNQLGKSAFSGSRNMAADIGGVFARGVEIGETADPDRQMHLDIGLLHQWQVTVFAPRVEQAAIRARSRVHSS
jgi:hypothetical protein